MYRMGFLQIILENSRQCSRGRDNWVNHTPSLKLSPPFVSSNIKSCTMFCANTWRQLRTSLCVLFSAKKLMLPHPPKSISRSTYENYRCYVQTDKHHLQVLCTNRQTSPTGVSTNRQTSPIGVSTNRQTSPTGVLYKQTNITYRCFVQTDKHHLQVLCTNKHHLQVLCTSRQTSPLVGEDSVD